MVFDGTRVIDATDVVVRDGKIEQVGKSLAAPAGAVVEDAKSCTLLPGLIDAHTHVFSETILEQALVFGVTTELDMFMSPDLKARIKREDSPARADLRSAGILVTAAGGHGTQFGVKIPTIDGPEAADKFVADRIAEGSDYIKIVFDDGRSLGLRFPTLTRETLAAVIAAAHKQGKLAVVHVGDHASAQIALELGADGLAHVPFDAPPNDGAFGKLAKSKNAFIIPTLAIVESACAMHGGNTLVADGRLSPLLSPADASALKANFPRIPFARKLSFDAPLASVRQLHDAGVNILAGTDAPNPGTLHGASMHREIELLVQAGLSPQESLAAATSVPAGRFGLKDRGRIAPGMRADLLLVKGDPTQDIRATRAIAAVWRGGQRVDRDAYRAKIEKVKAAGERNKGPGALLVSDFESGEIKSAFGAGWQVSTDSLLNGKSTAETKVVQGGAHASKSALRVSGNIDGGLPFAWAGAMFYPGDAPFAPADLSGKKAISFWAKGDGQSARVMLFAQKFGRQPGSQEFTPAKEWKQFRFELSAFNKADGSDLMGLLFTGGPKPGKFEFEVDDIQFE
jgi:imidazolonepropionase-like amidohydrolase